MSSMKIVVLILLEPALNEVGYVSKYIPLIEKYIDCNFFEVHLIGSYSGLKPLKEKFSNVHSVMFCPTATHGLGLYLGYLLYLTVAFFKVVQLVPKIGAHVLLSLGGHAYSGLIVTLTAKLLQRKSIVRISGPTRYTVWSRYRFGPLLSCFINVLERMTFSLCDIVISNRDMYWYSSKIVTKQRVLSQGVDLSLFNLRAAPAFHSKGFPKLITVARLDKLKNIGSVIEAVGLLEKRYPKILYHIVGSGPDEVDLLDKVTKLALNEHVSFHGYLRPEKIPGLLRSCDVFVLSSFIEGLPSAVLESMACGLPVIVGSAMYGLSEHFIDGENSLVVEGSPRSIAQAIDKLISDEELRNKLVVKGVRYVKEYHDSAKTKNSFSVIIQQLLGTSERN